MQGFVVFCIIIDVGYLGTEIDDGILRGVEGYLVVFENLIWCESFFEDGQFDDESCSLSFLAVAPDCSSVEGYQVLCQSEPKSGSDDLMLSLLPILETPEQVFHLLFGDAATSIAYVYNKVVEIPICLRLDGHLSAFFGVFGGI